MQWICFTPFIRAKVRNDINIKKSFYLSRIILKFIVFYIMSALKIYKKYGIRVKPIPFPLCKVAGSEDAANFIY